MYFNNNLCRTGAVAIVVAFVTACGGGGSAVTSTGVPTLNIRPSTPAIANALTVTVDTGPVNSGYNVNRLYTTITICTPGIFNQCQTIDHVLVDTGSTGLRLLASKMAPALLLSKVTGSANRPLLNCEQFVDNTFAWGPVVTADVILAGKTAISVPIQVIPDPKVDPAFGKADPKCSHSSTLTQMITPADLGANGILGIGLFKKDCGAACETDPVNGSYFTCTDANCTSTVGDTAILAKQITNPVPLFASDNNGVLIELPVVISATASSLQGSLIFGINTQTNNQLASTTKVLTADSLGYITSSVTLPGSQLLSLSRSFIDSGSNGFYFLDSKSSPIPTCPSPSNSFYCPAALTNPSATLRGANGDTSTFLFSIDKASTMFSDSSQAVLPFLSGPSGDPTSFDWGLPFFYGRRVFFGIEGMAPAGTAVGGPLYAF